MNSIFDSIFATINETATGGLSAKTVFIALGSAVIFGFLISFVYLFTHRKTGYRRSYVTTTVMLPAIAAIIIMLIGDNVARAFSLAGAFTLVRYRSDPSDPNDICYIFFALAMGVSLGLGYIGYASMLFMILALVILLMYFTGYGYKESEQLTLKITVPEDLNFKGVFDEILDEFTSVWKLRRVKTADFGSLFDLSYTIRLKPNADEKIFLDKLRTLNGNLNIMLFLNDKKAEYGED